MLSAPLLERHAERDGIRRELPSYNCYIVRVVLSKNIRNLSLQKKKKTILIGKNHKNTNLQ